LIGFGAKIKRKTVCFSVLPKQTVFIGWAFTNAAGGGADHNPRDGHTSAAVGNRPVAESTLAVAALPARRGGARSSAGQHNSLAGSRGYCSLHNRWPPMPRPIKKRTSHVEVSWAFMF